MLSKERKNQLSQNVVDIYNQVENEMLVNLAKQLKGQKDLLRDDPAAWQMKKLQALGVLNQSNLRALRNKLRITSAELNNLLYKAGIEGLDDSEKAIEKAKEKGAKLLIPPPLTESPQIIEIFRAYQDQAANTLNLTNQSMIDNAKQVYIDGINKTVADVLAGTKTHDQALRQTIADWAKEGIPALIDKAGRKWGTEGYVRTVMLTTIGNTANKIQDTRMQEYGIDLVEISSHSGARPLCAPYQGRIYSVSGNHPDYPPLSSTSMGRPAGLFGINCGHNKYPYIEGLSTQTYKPYNEKENSKVYEESQQQRKIERQIRKAKTEADMMKAAGDEDGFKKANQKVAAGQAKMRAFIDDTGRTRRRYREQIVAGQNTKPKPATKSAPKPKPNNTPPKETKTDTAKPQQPKGRENFLNMVNRDDLKDIINSTGKIKRKKALETAANRLIDKAGIRVINGVKVGDLKNPLLGGYYKPQFVMNPNGDGTTMLRIQDYALNTVTNKSAEGEISTMFHEFFHINAAGQNADWYLKAHNREKVWEEWTRVEETFTELAAHRMAKLSGINVDDVPYTYTNFMVSTIPILKKMPEFKHVKTLDDIADVAIEMRFDQKVYGWDEIRSKIASEERSNPFIAQDYVNKHYKKYADDNEKEILEYLYEQNPDSPKFAVERSYREGWAKGHNVFGPAFGDSVVYIMNKIGVK